MSTKKFERAQEIGWEFEDGSQGQSFEFDLVETFNLDNDDDEQIQNIDDDNNVANNKDNNSSPSQLL